MSAVKVTQQPGSSHVILKQSVTDESRSQQTTIHADRNPDGTIRIGWETRTTRVGTELVSVTAADLTLTESEFVGWVSRVMPHLEPRPPIRPGVSKLAKQADMFPETATTKGRSGQPKR